MSYDEASIARALIHHAEAGRVRSWAVLTAPRSAWRIDLADVGAHNYSTAQAWAICQALRAGEFVEQQTVEEMVEVQP